MVDDILAQACPAPILLCEDSLTQGASGGKRLNHGWEMAKAYHGMS